MDGTIDPSLLKKPTDSAAPNGEAPQQVSTPQPSADASKPSFGQAFAQNAAGGGGGGGGGGLMGLAKDAAQAFIMSSDRGQKKDVQAGGAPARSFLDALHAHEYRYKHPDAPGQAEGQFVSPMAQELEKAGPVGKSMVTDTPHGKMVDYGRGLATMLAAQADLHHRLKRLEGGSPGISLAAKLRKQ